MMANGLVPPVTVVGAGGIGCCLAAALCSKNHPVRMVEKCTRKINWIRQNGIQIKGLPPYFVSVESFSTWKPPTGDLILLCVKCYDNSSFFRHISPNLPVLPVQNGFDPELMSQEVVAEGIASFIGETTPGTAYTRITRKGAIHIGPRTVGQRIPFSLRKLGSLLDGNGIRPIVVPSILPFKYTKFLYNCAISPLASACGIDNGQLLANPRIRPIFLGLLKENLTILNNSSIVLGKVGPFSPKMVIAILQNSCLTRFLASWFKKSLDQTYCSMSGDWVTGKTELKYYLGHMIHLAGSTPCPLNRTLHSWSLHRLSENQMPTMDVISLLEKQMPLP